MDRRINSFKGKDPKDENLNSEKGASFIEYVLLATFIAVVCVVAVRTFGNKVSSSFSDSVSSMD